MQRKRYEKATPRQTVNLPRRPFGPVRLAGWLAVLSLGLLLNSCAARQQQAPAKKQLFWVKRAEWQAAPARPYKSHRPVRITVHHEGTLIDSTKNVTKFIKNIQTWGMGKDRNWADVPYHFFIGPDGRVYEGRDPLTAGETATEYDPSGHLLISCLGNFEKQEVPQAQLDALVALVDWCSKTYKIPVKTLSTHRDNSSQTTCPGKNLYRYFADGTIAKRLQDLQR